MSCNASVFFSSVSYIVLFVCFVFTPIAIYFVLLQVCPDLSERLRIFESLREKQSSHKHLEGQELPVRIQLDDGRTIKGTAGVTTPLFVSQSVR